MILEVAGANRSLAIAAYLAAIASGGVYSVRRAFHAARSLALDINVLMLVAVGGAMVLGQWSEGACVVFLFALAQLLEARAMERARGAIRALMDLAPAVALVRRDGADRELPVDEVHVGDIVIVRPGEKIPLDGRVAAATEPRQSGARDGRVAARRETAGRRGVRRNDQRTRRSRRAGRAPARRLDARPNHPSRRAGAVPARAQPDASSSGSRASTRRPCSSSRSLIGIDSAGARAGELERLDLSRAGAAGHLVSVRPRHLDPGVDRFGAGCCRAQRRAPQGRRASRAARGRAMRGVRQDRDADQGSAPCCRCHAHSTATAPERVLQLAASARSAVGASDRSRDRRARGSGGRSVRAGPLVRVAPGTRRGSGRRHDPRRPRQPLDSSRSATSVRPSLTRRMATAAGRRLFDGHRRLSPRGRSGSSVSPTASASPRVTQCSCCASRVSGTSRC